MFRRFVKFCVPSLGAACAAGLAASLAETAPRTSRPLETLAGAGFLLFFAVPLGLLFSASVRALYYAWDFPEMLSRIRDDRGASPRFCAWLMFLLASGGALWAGTFQGLRILFVSTRVNTLVALSAPIVVVGIAFFLVALSKPAVGALENLLDALERRRAEAGKPAIVKPLYLVVLVGMLAVLALAASWWLLILPSIGHLDIGFVSYLALFGIGLLLVPPLWKRMQGHTWLSGGVGVVLSAGVLVCIGLALWARYEKPYSMLEIWGETKLSGWAIDTLYDVQSLRVDLQIEGITPQEVPGAAHPNVVLITIDTVRADHVPLYGGKARMPRLANLGKKAVVFDRAFAPGNVTRRSVPTIATGLSPSRVRGRVAGWALKLDPRHILLAERFRAGGYDTAGFFCCLSHFGRVHKLGLIRGLDHVDIEYDALPLAKKSSNWIERRGKSDKPLFLWTHYIEPHNWTKDHKPGPEGRTKNARYNLSLAATDTALDVLLLSVYKTLGENTIVVVTSDHGEGLGDHGIPHHAGSLYNSEIRVPLVIAGPGITPGRIQQAVGLVDLAPTLMELAGFQAPGMPQMDGLSVAPELRGEREDALGRGEAYSQMVADRSVAQSQSAIISGRFKLIAKEGAQYELYDMSRDPRETKDIKQQAQELFASMKARLKRRQAVDRVPPF